MEATKSIFSYIPPLWAAFDNDYDYVEELRVGDLVEWDNYEETEIGVGIIKSFRKAWFYDYDTCKYTKLACAYVVNANPQDAYGYDIPLTHMDLITTTEYMELYEETYATSDEKTLSVLFDYITTRQATFRGSNGFGDSSMSEPDMSDYQRALQGGVQ